MSNEVYNQSIKTVTNDLTIVKHFKYEKLRNFALSQYVKGKQGKFKLVEKVHCFLKGT